MEKLLLRMFGVVATTFFGDTAVFDRWLWLRKNLRGGKKRTLDAGCGSGAFALYAAKRGNEVMGISFDERNNETAKRRAEILGLSSAEFIHGDLRRLDEMANSIGSFDQIICCETIEHIMNDEKLIHDFSHILRPGGRILLTAPYKYYDRIMGASISDTEDGSHVRWGYTHEEIGGLLEKFGLSLTAKTYRTGFISQRLTRWYRLLSQHISHYFAWGLIFPLRILVAFDPLITKLIRHPYLSIAVVAEKRASSSKEAAGF